MVKVSEDYMNIQNIKNNTFYQKLCRVFPGANMVIFGLIWPEGHGACMVYENYARAVYICL